MERRNEFICAISVDTASEYTVILNGLLVLGYTKPFTATYDTGVRVLSIKTTGKLGYSRSTSIYRVEGVPLYTFEEVVGHD